MHNSISERARTFEQTSRENTLNCESTNRGTACLQLRCVCVVESYRFNLSSWSQASAMARECPHERECPMVEFGKEVKLFKPDALEKLFRLLLSNGSTTLDLKKLQRIASKCSKCMLSVVLSKYLI